MGESNTEIFERLGRIEQTLARIDKRKGVMATLSLFSSIVGGALVWLFKTMFGGDN